MELSHPDDDGSTLVSLETSSSQSPSLGGPPSESNLPDDDAKEPLHSVPAPIPLLSEVSSGGGDIEECVPPPEASVSNASEELVSFDVPLPEYNFSGDDETEYLIVEREATLLSDFSVSPSRQTSCESVPHEEQSAQSIPSVLFRLLPAGLSPGPGRGGEERTATEVDAMAVELAYSEHGVVVEEAMTVEDQFAAQGNDAEILEEAMAGEGQFPGPGDDLVLDETAMVGDGQFPGQVDDVEVVARSMAGEGQIPRRGYDGEVVEVPTVGEGHFPLQGADAEVAEEAITGEGHFLRQGDDVEIVEQAMVGEGQFPGQGNDVEVVERAMACEGQFQGQGDDVEAVDEPMTGESHFPRQGDVVEVGKEAVADECQVPAQGNDVEGMVVEHQFPVPYNDVEGVMVVERQVPVQDNDVDGVMVVERQFPAQGDDVEGMMVVERQFPAQGDDVDGVMVVERQFPAQGQDMEDTLVVEGRHPALGNDVEDSSAVEGQHPAQGNDIEDTSAVEGEYPASGNDVEYTLAVEGLYPAPGNDMEDTLAVEGPYPASGNAVEDTQVVEGPYPAPGNDVEDTLVVEGTYPAPGNDVEDTMVVEGPYPSPGNDVEDTMVVEGPYPSPGNDVEDTLVVEGPYSASENDVEDTLVVEGPYPGPGNDVEDTPVVDGPYSASENDVEDTLVVEGPYPGPGTDVEDTLVVGGPYPGPGNDGEDTLVVDGPYSASENDVEDTLVVEGLFSAEGNAIEVVDEAIAVEGQYPAQGNRVDVGEDSSAVNLASPVVVPRNGDVFILREHDSRPGSPPPSAPLERMGIEFTSAVVIDTDATGCGASPSSAAPEILYSRTPVLLDDSSAGLYKEDSESPANDGSSSAFERPQSVSLPGVSETPAAEVEQEVNDGNNNSSQPLEVAPPRDSPFSPVRSTLSPMKVSEGGANLEETDRVAPIKVSEDMSIPVETDHVTRMEVSNGVSTPEETDHTAPMEVSEGASTLEETDHMAPAKLSEGVLTPEDIAHVTPVDVSNGVWTLEETYHIAPSKISESLPTLEETDHMAPPKLSEGVLIPEEIAHVTPVEISKGVSNLEETYHVAPSKISEGVSTPEETDHTAPTKLPEGVLTPNETVHVTPMDVSEGVSIAEEHIAPMEVSEGVSIVEVTDHRTHTNLSEGSLTSEVTAHVTPREVSKAFLTPEETDHGAPVKVSDGVLTPEETDHVASAKVSEDVSTPDDPDHMEEDTEDEQQPAKRAKRNGTIYSGADAVSVFLGQTAEIVLVLAGMAQMRAGRVPTSYERELAATAYQNLRILVSEMAPSNLVAMESLERMIQDYNMKKVAQKNREDRAWADALSEAEALANARAEALARAKAEEAAKVQAEVAARAQAEAEELVRKQQAAVQAAAIAAADGPGKGGFSSPGGSPVSSGQSAHRVSEVAQSRSLSTAGVHPSSQTEMGSQVLLPVSKAVEIPRSVTSNEKSMSINGQPNAQVSKPTLGRPPKVRNRARKEPAAVSLLTPEYLNVMQSQSTDPQKAHATHKQLCLGVQQFIREHIPPISQSLQALPPTYISTPFPCQVCKLIAKDTGSVLVCDSCDEVSHVKCVQPPSSRGASKGDWNCPKCWTASRGGKYPSKYGPIRHGSPNSVKLWPPHDVSQGSPEPTNNSIVNGSVRGERELATADTQIGPGPLTIQVEAGLEPSTHSNQSIDNPSAGNFGSSPHLFVHLVNEPSPTTTNPLKSSSQPLLQEDSERPPSGKTLSSPVQVLSGPNVLTKDVSTEEQIQVPEKTGMTISGQSDGLEIGQDDQKFEKGLEKRESQSPIDDVEDSRHEEKVRQATSAYIKETETSAQAIQSTEGNVDPEVTMPGKQAEVPLPIVMEWVGESVRRAEGKIYYRACSVGGITFSVSDCALFRPETPDVPPYIARLQVLWEDIATGYKWVRVSWCYYPTDIPMAMGRPGTTAPDEVYESNHCDNNLVGSIQGPCFVLSPLKFIEEREKRLNLGKRGDAVEDLPPIFLSRWLYDAPKGVFRPLQE